MWRGGWKASDWVVKSLGVRGRYGHGYGWGEVWRGGRWEWMREEGRKEEGSG